MLSGSGSDGAIGLKRLKERGGLVLVQDPEEAEFDGMPRSAIATGVVDVVLPARELAGKLVALVRGEAPVIEQVGHVLAPTEERVAARHRRACSAGTPATTSRSTSRRRSCAACRAACACTASTRSPPTRGCSANDPDEAQALFRDLLISVTNFFRDPDAFDLLERDVMPGLFEGKGPDDTVRVWSAGCATGEEAYSLAMLLAEQAGRMEAPPSFQVFATDLSEDALAVAREGVFADTIIADVSEERLARFFVREGGFYRIQPELRARVLFARHSLIKDPPFSRLDLAVCRNLLIYVERGVQRRVFELLHYALRPGGVLFLGTAEAPEGASDLFSRIAKKERIYRRQGTPSPAPRLPTLPLASLSIPAPAARRTSANGRAGGPPPPGGARGLCGGAAARGDAA